jgi:hypothetical protein
VKDSSGECKRPQGSAGECRTMLSTLGNCPYTFIIFSTGRVNRHFLCLKYSIDNFTSIDSVATAPACYLKFLVFTVLQLFDAHNSG